ncbi:MAG: MFS transporter, partial [Halieaceae bacterium]|nr:MFS transporter [Halieaceae bacterium]
MTSEPLSQADAEHLYREQVKRDLPRNFSAHLIHGMLGQTGFRLLNAPTFLPAFILLLSGGSDLAVGMALSLQALGAAITPLVGANLIEHRQQVLPAGFIAGISMRLMVLGVALSGFFLPPTYALYAVMVCLGFFGLFAGAQMVIFNVLLAKVIPVRNRGKLVGLRNFLAGITTACVAWWGGVYLVGDTPSADGYAWVFTIAFIMTSTGLLMLLRVREPRPPTVAPDVSLLRRLSQIPQLLREDPAFTRYFLARALTTMGRMALPFYILYAGQTIGLTGTTLATLTIAFTLAATVSNLAWGYLSDRNGFRFSFLLSVALWIGATVGLLISREFYVVVIIFAGIGAAQEGFRIASINMTL